MRLFRLLSLLAAAAGIAGCANLAPFTHQLRTDCKLTEPELRNLQYYVSGPIVLRRAAAGIEAKVTPQHTLRVIDGKAVEEVVVDTATPGIVEKVEDVALTVSFEAGGRLVFVADPVTPASPPARYRLRLDNSDAPTPEIQYQGKAFTLATPPTTYLLIDLDRLALLKKDSRTVPGRRLE